MWSFSYAGTLPTSNLVAGSVSNVAGPCEKFVNSTDQFYNSNSQTTFTEYRINRMSTELPSLDKSEFCGQNRFRLRQN